jgi:hypothetical protein
VAAAGPVEQLPQRLGAEGGGGEQERAAGREAPEDEGDRGRRLLGDDADRLAVAEPQPLEARAGGDGLLVQVAVAGVVAVPHERRRVAPPLDLNDERIPDGHRHLVAGSHCCPVPSQAAMATRW